MDKDEDGGVGCRDCRQTAVVTFAAVSPLWGTVTVGSMKNPRLHRTTFPVYDDEVTVVAVQALKE